MKTERGTAGRSRRKEGSNEQGIRKEIFFFLGGEDVESSQASSARPLDSGMKNHLFI